MCSGPGEVQSLELDLSPASLQRLLKFLQSSFAGGTDVDKPFELALARMEEEVWEASDILMVTDGEIRPPSEHILTQVRHSIVRPGVATSVDLKYCARSRPLQPGTAALFMRMRGCGTSQLVSLPLVSGATASHALARRGAGDQVP